MLNNPPSRMVGRIQRNLRDTLSRSFTVAWIGELLNESKRTLVDEIRNVQANFFKKSTEISVTSGTDEYNLPLDCPPNGVTNVEPLVTSYQRSRYYTRFNDRNKIVAGIKHFTTYHNGRRLVLLLRPTPTESETVTVWYQRCTVEMQYGTPSAIAATTLTLPASPTMGNRYYENDYPVGAYIMMTAGDAFGDVRSISSFVASTRIATVSSAWSATTNVSSMTYEILPDWIDDALADFLVLDATCAGLMREEDDPGEWKERRNAKLASVLTQVKSLQRVEPYRMELDREWWEGPTRETLPRDVRIP